MASRRCVVIGAGILGASVAARLAAAGLRVTLLDQDEPGRATSRWSFAWINSNNKVPRPYHDLNHAGMRAWAELAPDLDGDAWYRPVGHVELTAGGDYELEDRVKRLTGWDYPARLVDRAESHGAHVRTGEPGRVTGLEPGATPRVRTAVGTVLEADEVVCCAGRWTPALAQVPLVPWENRGSTAPELVARIGPAPDLVRLVHTP